MCSLLKSYAFAIAMPGICSVSTFPSDSKLVASSSVFAKILLLIWLSWKHAFSPELFSFCFFVISNHGRSPAGGANTMPDARCRRNIFRSLQLRSWQRTLTHEGKRQMFSHQEEGHERVSLV